MEFMIPLAALGGLFLVSRQKKDSAETFDTRAFDKLEYLPNTNLPDVNYPDMFKVDNYELERTSEISHNNRYDGGEAYTDKYFNPTSNGSVGQTPAMSASSTPSGITFPSPFYITELHSTVFGGYSYIISTHLSDATLPRTTRVWNG
jgi:hypothetical protein